MIYRTLDELFSTIKTEGEIKSYVVAAAEDSHSLEASFRVMKEGIAHPILVGDERKIYSVVEEMGENKADLDIVNVTGGLEASAQKAIDLVNEGRAEFVVKGMLDTSVILKAALKKENHFLRGGLASVVGIMEIPRYHKLICTTDAAMNMYPDLEQKKEILENAVYACRKIGIECPKVAVLCAIEKYNQKMPETVDAQALKEMNLNGEIKDCIVEGPISLDIALNKEAAEIKGFESEVAGDADILLFPNITAANIALKGMGFVADVRSTSLAVGLKVPLVISSRASTAEEKYRALLLAAAGDWKD